MRNSNNAGKRHIGTNANTNGSHLRDYEKRVKKAMKASGGGDLTGRKASKPTRKK